MKSGGATLIRKGLVVFQFTISIVLIVGTIIVYQQVQHIKHRDLGYNKDGLIEVPLTGTLRDHFGAIRQDLLTSGAMEDAGLTSDDNWYTQNNSSGFSGNIAADTPNVVITQSMERLMGKGSAIGKHIRDWRAEYQVVGVVNDYVYGEMYGQPDPVIFWSDPGATWIMFIRLKNNAPIDASLAKIGAVLQRDNPGHTTGLRQSG